MNVNVHIVGAGSIGMLFAGLLARQNHVNVTLISRSHVQVNTLSSQPLLLSDVVLGQTFHPRINVLYRGADRPSDIAPWSELSDTPDLLLLTVKQQHIDDSFVRQLYQRYGGHVPIVCLQNGIGHIERLQSTFSAEMLFTAVTTEAARAIGHAAVEHTGKGKTIVGPATSIFDDCAPSEIDNRANPRQAIFTEKIRERVINLFQSAGLEVTWSEHMKLHIWRKLLINAAINPLTATLQLRNGDVLHNPHADSLLQQMCAEAVRLSERLGFCEFTDLYKQVRQVCTVTARNESSMLQDLRRGNKTENEWIGGALLRVAEKVNVEMLTHRRLYLWLQLLEHKLGR